MLGIVGVGLAKGCHITAVTVGDELQLRRPTCGKLFRRLTDGAALSASTNC